MRPNYVPEGLWTAPLEWNLLATLNGEVFSTFANHVQRANMGLARTSFHRFQKLPVELQFHIIRLCDKATLFSLMSVSSALRKEASKLFWSDQDVWYKVNGHWLISGGHPASEHYNLDFLTNITQLEADFFDMSTVCNNWDFAGSNTTWDFGYNRGGVRERPPDLLERAQDFWKVVQRRCPRVVRVIISESLTSRIGSEIPHQAKLLAQQAPPHIETSISTLQMNVADRPGRIMEYTARQAMIDDWEVESSNWRRQSVRPPPKPWRGPVGAFCRLFYKDAQFQFMLLGLKLMKIKAVGKHLLTAKEPYTCYSQLCHRQFTDPDTWAAHIVRCRAGPEGPLPAEYDDVFKEHEKNLNDFYEKYHFQAQAEFFEECGKLGSQKRLDAKQAFLEQLERDPNYAHPKPARQSPAFTSYRDKLQAYDISQSAKLLELDRE